MKRIVSIELSIFLFLSCFFCLDFDAYALPSSGYCGKNLTYEFNESTGGLIISGSGKFYTDRELFSGDKNIKKVVINNGCTEVGAFAFADCTNLESIYIPATLDGYLLGVFWGCDSLTSIVVSPTNKTLDSRNDCNAIIETSTNTIVAGCKNTVIPKSVRGIDAEAFGGLTTIETFTVPEGVKTIGYCCFAGCPNLKSVDLPKSLKEIGVRSFSDCGKLKTINYNGTKSDWSKIDLSAQIITPIIHCSNGNMKLFRENDSEKYGLGPVLITGFKSKVYNSRAQKQSFKVKFGSKLLENGEDYTVSYQNNTKVGKATAIFKGQGIYYGTIKKTFKINPKGTTVSKLSSPKSKQIKVVWEKQTTQTTGYQIQYATNSKFTSNKKTVTVSSNKTTSKTIKNLRSRKKYYVRVRTYKTVNGKNYYSSWSKAKSVKSR